MNPFAVRSLSLLASFALAGSFAVAAPDGEPKSPASKSIADRSSDKASSDKPSSGKPGEVTDKQAERIAKRATKAASKPANRPERNLPVFTLEREAAATLFVKQHHPELLSVLNQLKVMNGDAYQDAIRELFQTSETIARWLPGDARMHELALEAWKVKSRIDLLAVALRKDRRPEQETQLRKLLHRQIELQIEQTEFEAQRLRLRSEKLAADAERLKSDRDRAVEERLARLAPKKKSAGSPAAKPGRIAGSADPNKAATPGESGKNLGSPQKPESEREE